MVVPPKLHKGDEVRIVAPSRSMEVISEDTVRYASKTLEGLGLHVTFSKNFHERGDFASTPVEARTSDLHEAYADKNVKAILTLIGGFNSNQLLRYLDYNLIKNNPKILCGYSDITALQDSIYRKTKMVTYYGPHFSSFAMQKGLEYTMKYFKECLFRKGSFEVEPSAEWSNDPWYRDQGNRSFVKNEGFASINGGEASGKVIGGNLCTLNLLQGTEFMPSLKDCLLFIEDDDLSKPETFDRDLVSLIHQKDFGSVRGIAIGRFERESKMSRESLVKIIKGKRELRDIPVVANLDFGHTTPQITFPIGGSAEIKSSEEGVSVRITRH